MPNAARSYLRAARLCGSKCDAELSEDCLRYARICREVIEEMRERQQG